MNRRECKNCPYSQTVNDTWMCNLASNAVCRYEPEPNMPVHTPVICSQTINPPKTMTDRQILGECVRRLQDILGVNQAKSLLEIGDYEYAGFTKVANIIAGKGSYNIPKEINNLKAKLVELGIWQEPYLYERLENIMREYVPPKKEESIEPGEISSTDTQPDHTDRLLMAECVSDLIKIKTRRKFNKESGIHRVTISRILKAEKGYSLGAIVRKLGKMLQETNLWHHSKYREGLSRIYTNYDPRYKAISRITKPRDIADKRIKLTTDLVIWVKPEKINMKSIAILFNSHQTIKVKGVRFYGYVTAKAALKDFGYWDDHKAKCKITLRHGMYVRHKIDLEHNTHMLHILKSVTSRKGWCGLTFTGRVENPQAVKLPVYFQL